MKSKLIQTIPPVREPSAAFAACAWLSLWATLRNRTRSKFFCSWTATRFLRKIMISIIIGWLADYFWIIRKIMNQFLIKNIWSYLQSLNSKCKPTLSNDLLFSTAFVMAISTLFPKNCACWLLALISDKTCWTLAA